MELKITSDLEHDKWAAFVEMHKDGNIFQTPEMFEVLRRTKNYTPILLAAIDRNQEVQGLMVAVIQSESSNFLGRFSARAIIWGGPLIKDANNEVLKLVLEAYDKAIKRRVIYSQFRNFWIHDDEQKKIFNSLGFVYEDHLNILVDLTKTQEQLWKEVKSTRRKTINKSKRSGVVFKELTDPQDIRESYNIVETVYKNARLPYPDGSLFEVSRELLSSKDMVKFFGAFHEEKMIGTRAVLCYKDYVFDWYAGSYKEFYNLRPNDFLPWEVFLWGKQNHYSLFDFGGAGHPDVPYGVRDYKLKFCSDLVNPGRFQKVHKPILMGLGKFALKLYQKLK